MSGINTDEFMSISFDLQKIALVLAIIGFIILRVGKLSKGNLGSSLFLMDKMLFQFIRIGFCDDIHTKQRRAEI